MLARSGQLGSHARPYNLRHSFASLLLHEGRSVIYVARQLGHDARLTLTRYGHVIEELDDTPLIEAEAAGCERSRLPASRIHDSIDASGGLLVGAVSSQAADNSEEHDLELPVEELLRRARPLPPHDEMVIEDLTEEEGAAFLAAVEL